jgi:hypothetical protein
MAANDNSQPSHYFHAEAHALSGKLILPFEEQIKKQALVKLEGDSKQLLLEAKGDQTGEGEDTRKLREKRAQENYLSQHSKNYRLESIISYSAAHTQVSGHRSKKHPDRFVTLATSVVENLNVLNVVTADRVVAQISTTHIPGQYSPEVTFLGTHFEGLRIARHKAEPALNLAFAGERPVGEAAYYPTEATKKEKGLMASAEKLYEKLRTDYATARARMVEAKLEEDLRRLEADDSWFAKQYHRFSNFNYEELGKAASAAAAIDNDPKTRAINGDKWEGVTCSLVDHIEIENIEIPVNEPENADPIVIRPPAHSFGHVIHVPDFGTIFLAELKVNHNSFNLTMIRLELGCIADGTALVATCHVNGKGGGG